ncbi:MAG: Fic family protein [Bacilli bacterium]|nr:Fic family protein [Bacilli bacterium]MDY6391963.1 Fic family protein [Bacilli bacterium]
MKTFDLKGAVLSLNTPNIVSLLNNIEFYKGKTAGEKPKKLDVLRAIAYRSGAVASNAIGNVYIAEDRERVLCERASQPKTLQEHMVLGYLNAVDLITEVAKYQTLDMSFITTLHYYIYKDYNPEFGGKFKDSQNYIQESLPDGSFRTIFVSAPPEYVPQLLDNLIYQFNECAKDEECNKLVLIACFMLDFMCIHPYNHGNGRVSRLLLHFLLKKYGYDIDDYFAISYLMKQHLGEYIDAFRASSEGWHDSENNYEAFVTFILRRVLEAYRKLDYIYEINALDCTSEEKVLRVVNDSATPISKTMVLRILYPISKATIEKALAKLLREGRIQLVTKGRYSRYFRI